MLSVKFDEDLYLTRCSITPVTKKPVAVVPKVNHIWIYDRSGSMYSLLGQLAKDLIEHSKTLMLGDTLSVGWFSSEGQFRFILKGHIVGPDSYSAIERLIDANKTTIGMTCFSDILADTKSVIDDLSVFGQTYAFMFFTDGYPVVSNYNAEIAKIFKAIEAIKGSITASLFIGYGAYYNKELMSKMANAMGGSLLHSERMSEFTEAASAFIGRRKVAKKVKEFIPFAKSFIAAFTVDSDGVVTTYEMEEPGNFVLIPEDTTELYVLSDTAGSKASEKVSKVMVGAAYGAALIFSQRAEADRALKILSKIGDIALVDEINNAWTNAEYGRAEKRITKAILLPRERFSLGKKVGYGPRDDDACLLDVVDMLSSDDFAIVHPFSPSFKYKRTGVKRVPKAGYPEFHHGDDVSSPFGALTWNSERLNLSMLLKIPGWINLGDDYEANGFTGKTFRTFIYRNYMIVKDGILNIETLPMELSEQSFNYLWGHGAIAVPFTDYIPCKIYDVDLSRFPVMNRLTANMANNVTGKYLAELTMAEIKNQAMQKVCKKLIEELDDDGTTKQIAGYTKEQSEYLKTFGVTGNGFAPPVEEVESTDYYWAKSFDVSAKGFSSLPSVDKVRQKISDQKPFTPGEAEIATALFNAANIISGFDKEKKIDLLQSKLKEVKNSLSRIRSEIARIKFSVILAKRWFKDLSTRDGAVVNFNNVDFTFKIEDVKVEY
jgi:hypothetical protein